MDKIKRFFKVLGPGFITGASDDDPSGIATYSQTGAMFGFSQAWTALFSFPLMTTVQEMCGRIGLVSGHGLAGVIKEHYSRKTLYPIVLLLLIANVVNIGADLGAMAASLDLVSGLPFSIWLFLIVLLTLSLELFIPYKTYTKYLKYLALVLFAYVLVAFTINADWSKIIFSTFVPSFGLSSIYLANIVAILGTTISPYLFFWQAEEEVEEEDEKLKETHHLPKVTGKDIFNLRIDTLAGMFFSNIIMWFIIVTVGATLYPLGIRSIGSAEEAALALRPIAGDFAFALFTAGIVGTGFLAIPVLAGSASYAVAEAFGWQAGLTKKFKKARSFYLVIAAATMVGLFINFVGINPVKALYYSAILNGIIAPPLLFAIIVVANDKKIMGGKTNPLFSNVLGGLTILVMTVAAVFLVLSFSADW